MGERLSTTGLVVRADYTKGRYTTVVTGRAALSGFSTRTIGTRTVTVRFSDGSASRTSRFGYRVVKAATTTRLTLSTTTVKRARTKVAVTATLSRAVTARKPSGRVRFYRDGVAVGTVVLKNGTARLRYPVFRTAGRHTITVRYFGTSSLAASRATTIITVR
ncbi:Ig-like domain-containing protein [Micropruina sp.]|uniref:Ig-like domain-containing protein n=1 Tax=Micropruina sp. TaxID=2737536 RepID=UPI0039E45BEA